MRSHAQHWPIALFALIAELEGGALAMSALGLAAGCSKGGDTPAVTEPSDLQMVSPGNEPRKQLRYRIPKGTTQGIEVTVDMMLKAGDMGGPLPSMTTSMVVAIEDVNLASQAMTMHTTIVDATAHDREGSTIPAQTLTAALDTMKGLALETTLSPLGRVTKGEVQGGKQLSEDVNKQLSAVMTTIEQVVMPLPMEPVGVGAVWRVSRDIEQNGMKMTAVNTMLITALDGDKMTYTIDTTVHGADQSVHQGDQTLELKDITGTGTGKGTISLTKLDINSVLDAEFRSQMSAPGDEKPTAMKMTMQTTVKPK
jgi:hypothetical protein